MSHDTPNTPGDGTDPSPEHVGPAVDSVLAGVLLVQGDVPSQDASGGLRGATGAAGRGNEKAWIERVLGKWGAMKLCEPINKEK